MPRNPHRHGVLAERQGLRALRHAEHRADRSGHRALAATSIPSNVVFISEYTGGGFGSKITGAISAIIPALLSKKTGAPVMMRISREEEHYIGRARPSLHGRMKVGFTKEGRITAIDMFVVMDNGPYDPQGDANQSGRIVSLMYQPPAMRWRGITVLTNTPPRVSQSQPGGLQGIALMEPILAKAARKLGVDQVAIRRINAPEGKAPIGPPGANGKRPYVTSAFIKEALDRGAEQFEWEKRKAQPKRSGTKVRGVGVAISCFVGGSIGFDGLFVIKPDGKLYIQSGIGNLGTESVSDCASRDGRNPRRAVGEMRNHLGQHGARTCRGPALPAAARPPTP